jgi:hypothetical protein
MTGIGKSQGHLEKKHDERTKYLKSSPSPLKELSEKISILLP